LVRPSKLALIPVATVAAAWVEPLGFPRQADRGQRSLQPSMFME
jgi:hypothetical protein